MTMAQLGRPAETAVLGDCTSTWGGGYWSSAERPFLARYAYAAGTPQGCGCPPDNTLIRQNGTAVHNEGTNFAFADGHAKWFSSASCKTVSGGGSLRYFDTEW